MRMARLRYKIENTTVEFIGCPTMIVLKQTPSSTEYSLFQSSGFGYVGILDTPIEEAIEELNAAMVDQTFCRECGEPID